MKLNFTIDTEDLYGEDGIDFEHVLIDSIKQEIINTSKDEIASEKFKEFSRLTSDTLVAEIKLKLENFLSEEISLTERWGDKTFVGSIEDLIKMRFDDILLKPVDNNGKTIQGCTSSGKTWVEWLIEQKLGEFLKSQIEIANKHIKQWIGETISEKLIAIKDEALKEQVNSMFLSILKKS